MLGTVRISEIKQKVYKPQTMSHPKARNLCVARPLCRGGRVLTQTRERTERLRWRKQSQRGDTEEVLWDRGPQGIGIHGAATVQAVRRATSAYT